MRGKIKYVIFVVWSSQKRVTEIATLVQNTLVISTNYYQVIQLLLTNYFGEVSYDQPNESSPDFENSEHRDEMNLSLICSQTPIYEVTEQQAECEDLPLTPPGPVITVGETVQDCSVTAPDANDSFANMLKEVSSKAEKRDAKFEKEFLSRLLSKIEANLKSNTDKNMPLTSCMTISVYEILNFSTG